MLPTLYQGSSDGQSRPATVIWGCFWQYSDHFIALSRDRPGPQGRPWSSKLFGFGKIPRNIFWLVTRLSDLCSSTMEHLIISIRHKTNPISVLGFLFDFQMQPKIFHNRHFQFGQFFQFVIHHLEQNFQ